VSLDGDRAKAKWLPKSAIELEGVCCSISYHCGDEMLGWVSIPAIAELFVRSHTILEPGKLRTCATVGERFKRGAERILLNVKLTR